MASQVYNSVKGEFLEGNIDLVNDDIRVKLLMTNTTADSENDGITNLSDFTTLDEQDGTNYAVKALSGKAVAIDTGNDRAEFDADDVTWTSLGAGTRDVAGILVYKHVDGTDANDIAIAWVEKSGQPDGSNFTINWDAEGILQLT